VGGGMSRIGGCHCGEGCGRSNQNRSRLSRGWAGPAGRGRGPCNAGEGSPARDQTWWRGPPRQPTRPPPPRRDGDHGAGHPPSPTPAPAASSRPLTLVESGQRLTHQLRPSAALRDELDESTPTRRAHVPDHDDQAESPPPREKPSSRRAKAAKWGAAVYMARWINTRGENGPWSQITMATVAGEGSGGPPARAVAA
jgi:hypothetical protein